MAKFTQIPTDTFKKLQLGAGLLTTDFDTKTGELTASSIVGATSGGVSFEATPSFSDFGEDIDNCPKNTKELKKLDGWEAKMSGSFVTMDTKAAVSVIGTAAVAERRLDQSRAPQLCRRRGFQRHLVGRRLLRHQ